MLRSIFISKTTAMEMRRGPTGEAVNRLKMIDSVETVKILPQAMSILQDSVQLLELKREVA